MNRVENFWQLHPNRSQIIYIEKAAVIDFLRSDAPKSQAIRLRVQQFVELIETALVTRIPVDLCERFFDCLLYLRRLGTTTFQPPFDDFLLSRALCDPLRVGFGAFRQILKCG